MKGRLLSVVGLCALTLAACSKTSTAPSTPGSTTQTGAGGSTLKTDTPTPQSPINNQLVTTTPIVLVVSNASPTYAANPANVPLQYRFEIYDSAGTLVHSASTASGAGTTSYAVPVDLEGDKPYQWSSRTEYQGAVGAWSARAAFVAPSTTGYIRGNELYDPLLNGKSIGNIVGPVTFIPGVGIKLDTPTSYIAYQLQGTLEEGEISAIVTNMPTNTEGNKTKVFAMAQGYDNLTVNVRRMTVEKRGDTQGSVAWRFITDRDQIDTEGAERVGRNFNPSLAYYFRATWGYNFFFRLTIHEGGVDGREIYNFGKPFDGYYDPNPHVVYIGSPPTQSGPDNQSIQDMVIRQLWVSSRPRPSYAKK
jgi:hypothetical protein